MYTEHFQKFALVTTQIFTHVLVLYPIRQYFMYYRLVLLLPFLSCQYSRNYQSLF